MRYCISCLNLISDENDMCRYCGYSQSQYHCKPNYIAARTKLEERYFIGIDIFSDPYGVTYKAIDTVMERKVLIRQMMVDLNSDKYQGGTGKRLLDHFELRNAFLAFYKKLALLDLPGIADVYTCTMDGLTVFSVRKFVAGIELNEFMNKNGAISYDQAVTMLYPIMSSVRKLHSLGMYHGNICLSNVFVDDQNRLCLDEFPGVEILHNRTPIKRGEAVQGGALNFANDVMNLLMILVKLVCGQHRIQTPKQIDRGFLKEEDNDIPYDVRMYIHKVFCEKHPAVIDETMYELYGESSAEEPEEESDFPDELYRIVREKDIMLYDYGSSAVIDGTDI